MKFKAISFFAITLILNSTPLSASVNPAKNYSEAKSRFVSYIIRAKDSADNSQRLNVVNVDCTSDQLTTLMEVINKTGYLVDIKYIDANTHQLVPAVFESGYKLTIDRKSCPDGSKKIPTMFSRISVDAKWVDDRNKLKATNSIESPPVAIQGSDYIEQEFMIDGKERYLFALGSVKYYLAVNFSH